MAVAAGWRGEVNLPGLTQVRPDLLLQVTGGTLGPGTYCIEFERYSPVPSQVEHKLGPYRRMAASGRPMSLLVVCERPGAGTTSGQPPELCPWWPPPWSVRWPVGHRPGYGVEPGWPVGGAPL